MKVRLGTRGSDLALWQAHTVSGWLAPEAETEIVVIKTRGDRITDIPLTQVDGKAFFTAEIEQSLLDGSVDLAVHSHKDLATENPPRLTVSAIPVRGPSAELLIMSPAAHDVDAPLLPIKVGARVGTSAPRRRAQLVALRPDLKPEHLRGNVPTRVEQLRAGAYDAVVLAAAGVRRLELDLSGLVVAELPPESFVPAPAQGALAVQTRVDDEAVSALMHRRLHDQQTADAVVAERSLLQRAGGGCNLPLGAQVTKTDAGWAAHLFAGADCPSRGLPARWARGVGRDPQAAVDVAWEDLVSGRPTGAGPLAGCSVELVGVSSGGTALGARLAGLGADVVHRAVLEIEAVPAGVAALDALLADLKAGDWVAVTSRAAARALAGRCSPAGVRVAAVGASTAGVLAEGGWSADHVGSAGAAELAAALPLASGARVLFPCGEDALPDLPTTLEARGATVRRLEVYRAVPCRSGGADASGPLEVRVYMSPSAVTVCHALGLESDGPRRRLALGATTAATLDALGLPRLPLAAGSDRSEAAVAALAALVTPSSTRLAEQSP